MSTRNLIVFFSRRGENLSNYKRVFLNVGNTERLANKICRLVGGDLFPIHPVTPYPDSYEAVSIRSRSENEQGAFPEIESIGEINFTKYDNVYLGFPIWERSFPRVIASFIKEAGAGLFGKRIFPFCTNEEGSFGTAELELRGMVRGATLCSGFAVHGYEVDECNGRLAKWLGVDLINTLNDSELDSLDEAFKSEM